MKLVVIALILIIFPYISQIRAEDHALIVGTDKYADPNLSTTDGAADDARAMQRLLIEKFGFAPGSIKLLIDDQATARNIVSNFETWLIGGTRPGDRVFFFYAGHGFQAPDDNDDEEDNEDEVITPYDVAFKAVGGKVVLTDENTFIRDDKFNDFIARLSGRRAVLMFDSCHSGTISRGLSPAGKYLESRYLRLKPTRSLVDNEGYSAVPAKGRPRDISSVRETAVDGNVNGVVVLSAASPYQQAFPIVTDQNVTRGAFSYIFETLVRQKGAEKLRDLEADLKREMKNFADKGLIGQSTNGEFQVPQVDVISKTPLADKPLFAAASPGDNMGAAVQSALFNPLSAMKVKLDVGRSRYKIGDKISYSVDVSDTSYLYILVFSADNKAFCIFPTSIGGDTLNKVMKGRYDFPRDGYETEATEPAGKDVWVALASRTPLRLGEKEEYTWDEMFGRIGLAELQKAIADKVARLRGAKNVKSTPLTADGWQADTVVVETVRD